MSQLRFTKRKLQQRQNRRHLNLLSIKKIRPYMNLPEKVKQAAMTSLLDQLWQAEKIYTTKVISDWGPLYRNYKT